MSGWGILENLTSDIIFLLLAILVGWLWVSITHRRQLQNFFGVNKTKRLCIYLSHINVLKYGSTGIDEKMFSYTGEAVDYGEMQAANRIRNLFSSIIPKLTEASKTIGKLLLSDIEINLDISPDEQSKLETQASFIALGSPAYNTASSYIESFEKGIVKFQIGYEKSSESEDNTVHSASGSSISLEDRQHGHYAISPGYPPITPSGEGLQIDDIARGTANPYDPRYASLIAQATQANPNINREIDKTIITAITIKGIPPITDTTYGFIERIKEPITDRMLFYVAGLSEFGTKAAANYLASHWFDLYKKCKKAEAFFIMLSFNDSDPSKASIIFPQSQLE
jgi:hypothetical protein